MLHLVRHGRPLIDPARPADQWPLDPDHADDVRRLRDAWATGLPADAWWASSAEPKAVATAQLLTGRTVEVEPDLGEHRRGAGWLDDVPATVTRAFARPEERAAPGWEPLARCRARVVPAVRRILAERQGREVVLVGHGTAWTVLVAALTGGPADLDRWRSLGMPDVVASLAVPTIIG